jgi:hypothetical protein
MKSFKFLSDDKDDEIIIQPYNGASWLFVKRENLDQQQYDVIEENYYGIHSFLNQFPSGFVACVLTIVGPNGRLHDADSVYVDGWGFSITSDYINIRWVRFRE